jgi:methylthioribose-1-phosphate isomerase
MATQPELRTVWWRQDARGEAVCMIDQSLLPERVVELSLTHEAQVAGAIATLRVRGAPAIGVTAALGMALAACRLAREQEASGEQEGHRERKSVAEMRAQLETVGAMLRATRPTAVNLAWGVERVLRAGDLAISQGADTAGLARRMRDEALAVAEEDAEACRRMGMYGAELISDGDALLTHCNAGALATSGMGSALAPVYVAHRSGKRLHVYVDETRPVLQGARLTAWELQRAGVPLTLITDNMAAHFMRHGGIRAVFVGADRIAANGDVANKIGTYSVATLAHAHDIPLYVVAPRSTIDLRLPSGDFIPIEQRDPSEVTSIRGVTIAPEGVQVANPAFDVTPHRFVRAIITEAGIARPPYEESLRILCDGYHIEENT